MKTTPNSYRGSSLFEVLFALVVIACLAFVILGIPACHYVTGTGGFGPYRTEEVEIKRAYVDTAEKSSHYMVSTDKGMFEVDNGLLLGVDNADELYGKFQAGKKYRITTKGNKVVRRYFFFFLMQEYPYITQVEELK